MDNKEYADFVRRRVKPGTHIMESLSPIQCDLLHMAVGVCTEAGELLDAVKKNVIYEKELDFENVIEELGDLEFYLQGIRNNLIISRKEVIHMNVQKLKKRYEEKYTNEQAIERKDKDEDS